MTAETFTGAPCRKCGGRLRYLVQHACVDCQRRRRRRLRPRDTLVRVTTKGLLRALIDRRGAAAVEAALILPGLTLLLVGILATGNAEFQRQRLMGAAQYDASAAVAGTAGGQVAAIGGVETLVCNPCNAAGDVATVTASLPCGQFFSWRYTCAANASAIKP